MECFLGLWTMEKSKWNVKNRFSDLTKVLIGQDQYRIDIMNDHQEKALQEGCCERDQAQMDVSSIEKTNTK